MEKASGEREEHMSSPPKFEDIGAWQLVQDLTCKVNGRKVTLNGEPQTCKRLYIYFQKGIAFQKSVIILPLVVSEC
jgi:hypothetical protein